MLGWYHARTVGQKQALWAWVFLALPLLFFASIRLFPTGYTSYV